MPSTSRQRLATPAGSPTVTATPAIATGTLRSSQPGPPHGRRSLLGRRDDLEERVAEREHRVAKAEVRDARVGERLPEAELVAEAPGDRVEVARREDGLPEPNPELAHGRRVYAPPS